MVVLLTLTLQGTLEGSRSHSGQGKNWLTNVAVNWLSYAEAVHYHKNIYTAAISVSNDYYQSRDKYLTD